MGLPSHYILELEFELTLPLNINQIHNGPDNNFYIVTDSVGRKIGLRESKRKDKNINYEIEVLLKLLEAGLSVPHPIRGQSGKYFLINDTSQIVAFDFILGNSIKRLKIEDLTKEYIEIGARKLGELHAISPKLSINSVPSRTIFNEFERFLKLSVLELGKFRGVDFVVKQANYYYTEAKTRLNSNRELCGMIHNDFRIQNLIFNETDCYMIDFDWSCYGPLNKDLGLAVAEWSIFNPETGPVSEAINRFLSNYNNYSSRRVLYGKDLLFWICFACLSEVCTSLTDISNGQYQDFIVEDVNQLYMYRKFIYFHNEEMKYRDSYA